MLSSMALDAPTVPLWIIINFKQIYLYRCIQNYICSRISVYSYAHTVLGLFFLTLSLLTVSLGWGDVPDCTRVGASPSCVIFASPFGGHAFSLLQAHSVPTSAHTGAPGAPAMPDAFRLLGDIAALAGTYA